MNEVVEVKNPLLEGNIAKSLMLFAVPIILSKLLQTVYGAVDVFMIGRYGTVEDMTAVTTGFQWMEMVASLCIGLSVGTTVLIGKKIGEGRKEDVDAVIVNSVELFLALSLMVTAFMLIGNSWLVEVFKTPAAAIPNTAGYLFYAALGVPMIFAYNVLGAVFRGLGDAKTPLFAVAIAAALNVALDYILLEVYASGAAGVAVATSVAQGISVVICILFAMKKGFAVKKSPMNFNIMKTVSNIGAPVAMQNVLSSFSFMAVIIIVNRFDRVDYSAGMGVADKICGFIMLLPMAFVYANATFVSQNVGANRIDRVRDCLKVSIGISVIFGAVMWYISYFQGEYLVRIFNDDPVVVPLAVDYLKSYSFDAACVSILFCCVGFFNGLGRTTFVMLQGLVGCLAIRVPLAYWFSCINPDSLYFIGLSTPIARFAQIIICVVFYIKIKDDLVPDYMKVSDHHDDLIDENLDL